MLHGAQLAVDEANARGGYGGKPFSLMLHNDYDNWQAKAVYGDDRPNRSGHLGLGLERSREDDLRRAGLGHLRLDQLRVDAHHACALR